jgi:hypothetical protein
MPLWHCHFDKVKQPPHVKQPSPAGVGWGPPATVPAEGGVGGQKPIGWEFRGRVDEARRQQLWRQRRAQRIEIIELLAIAALQRVAFHPAFHP